jgi:hypothetical protein
VAIATGLTLLLLVVLLGIGDRIPPHVRDYSWQNRTVTAADTILELQFNRLMDEASIEANLRVDPPLPGRMRWLGQRLVYTLAAPARYGRTYTVQVTGGKTASNDRSNPSRRTFAPAIANFWCWELKAKTAIASCMSISLREHSSPSLLPVKK